jgi:hypothetical protein
MESGKTRGNGKEWASEVRNTSFSRYQGKDFGLG